MDKSKRRPNVIGIIPARLASSRFPGKVLADLCGKPVLQHVYERAARSRQLDDLIVACDDSAVKHAVESFGGRAVLTSKKHATGTDRILEVIRSVQADWVVNIQGDEPLVRHDTIDRLVELMKSGPPKDMGTVIHKSTDFEAFQSPHVVKVVTDHAKRVLYFSRSPIPYGQKQGEAFYRHVGMYAYTLSFLNRWNALPASPLEKTERLEQLRAMQNGVTIWATESPYPAIGIDTPEDLIRVRELLTAEPTEV